MKHNTYSALLIIMAILFNVSACTDYTKDIEGAKSPAGTDIKTGGGELPPELLKPNEGDFSESKMLANIGLNVVSRNVEDLFLETKRFRREVTKRCEAYKINKNAQAMREPLQQQWTDTMLAYHRVSAAGVGPLSENNGYLSSHIYSWPFINTCGVDLEVARYASKSDKATPMDEMPVNKKGFGALEYLLYASVEESGCRNLIAITNKDAAEWLKKTTEEKLADRCDYIQNISADLESRIGELYRRWEPQGGNYTKEFFNKSLYPTTKMAINAVSDAMFSVEYIKDAKIGIPLGALKGCDNPSGLCPEMIEHTWSGLGASAIQAQIMGFKEVFYGHTNPTEKAFGFDDYLASKGHGDVVARFEADMISVEEALVVLQASDLPLQKLVENTNKQQCTEATANLTNEPACALYFRIRKLTTFLKIDMLTLLSLDAPAVFQGDND